MKLKEAEIRKKEKAKTKTRSRSRLRKYELIGLNQRDFDEKSEFIISHQSVSKKMDPQRSKSREKQMANRIRKHCPSSIKSRETPSPTPAPTPYSKSPGPPITPIYFPQNVKRADLLINGFVRTAQSRCGYHYFSPDVIQIIFDFCRSGISTW